MATPPTIRLRFRCHLFLAASLVLVVLAAALFAASAHRTVFLVAELVTNLLAVAGLTAAMFELDRPLRDLPGGMLSAPVLGVKLAKRFVLLFQLLTTALFVAALFALLFHFKFPGT
jgi:hypothetical protein